ncbi:MAG: DUF4340 domain-containing protein [Thermodesulfobacteriota bacterium]
MKWKKEYLVLSVVIVGLSVYLLLHRADRTHYQLPVLPKVEKKTITRIEIVSPKQTMVLNRKGENWVLNEKEYPADTVRVDDMLDVLEDLTLTDLVSESENYGRYDLDADKRIQIRAWVGDSVKRDMAIGRAATSFRHTFVRMEGDPRVYHARENFRNRFEVNQDQLRDKSVFSFEKSDILEIHVVKDKQPVVDLVRQEVPVEAAGVDTSGDSKKQAAKPKEAKTVWQAAGGETMDVAKVERLLGALSMLKCNRYIDDKQKTDFIDPVYTVRVKGAQEHSLSVFAKGDGKEGQYPAISSQNDYPFLLSGTQAEAFMTIFDAAPPEKTEDRQ